MALHYIEFDTNPQALLQDLRTQILTSTDWARLTPDTILLNTSGATAAGATVLPFANTTSSGLSIGSVIAIDDGTTRESRTITNMTATTITVAAMSFAHAAGSAIRQGNHLYKATTTRGADMVIDLNDSHLAVTDANLQMAIYRAHDGTTGQNKMSRYLYWRTNAGAANNPLHVTLSLSKEHFFLGIEGPRVGEAGAQNGTYGSLKGYVFLSDLVPYDVADTNPVVFAGGQSIAAADGSFANSSHIGHLSEDLDGVEFWTPTRLATLEFPKAGYGDVVNFQRQRRIDDTFTLAPYVAFTDDTGMRGRLSSFFFAGFNYADQFDVPIAPTNTKVEYQGQWYKLIAVSKSDSARHCWAQFGATTQNAATTYTRSPVVAVPCLP